MAGYIGANTAPHKRRSFRLSKIVLPTLLLTASAWAQAVPTFTKTFVPDTIGPGSVSTLQFDITNNDPGPVSNLAFTDTLPSNVTIADPANASTTCLNGAITAPDGGSTITFSDGTLGTALSCSVFVDVTSATPGVHSNVSGDLTSDAGNSGNATADLTIATDRPGFSMSFSPNSVPLGGRSTLTYTIDNTANGTLAFPLIFTNNLPTGIEIASPANASNTCNGILTAVSESNTISLNSGFVAIGGTCTISVDVIATGSGEQHNVSGELTSGSGLNPPLSGKASDTLDVTTTPLALTKTFTNDPVPAGETVTLEFTILNLDRNFPATGISFTDDLSFSPSTGISALNTPLVDPCGPGSTLSGTGTLALTGGYVEAGSSCTFSVDLQIPAGETVGAFANTTSAVTGDVNGSPVTGNLASDTLFISPSPRLTTEFLEVGTLQPDPTAVPGDDVVIRFTIENTSATDALTDIAFMDEVTTFLSFPPSVTLPPVPNPPCGPGSSMGSTVLNGDRYLLSLTGGNLGAGSTCTFDVTATLPTDLATNTYVNTTQEITGTINGNTVTGLPATDTLSVIAAPRLVKEFTDDPVLPGGTVNLQFTLTHHTNAPGDATNVTFTDDLASTLAGLTGTGLPLTDLCGPGNGELTGSAGDTLLTFSSATLTPGQVCSFSVPLQVPAGAALGDHTNTTSDVTAVVLGKATNAIPATADLAVTSINFSKEFIDNPVIPGGTPTLRFTIDNIGTMDATGIFFTDSLSTTLSGLVATALPSTPCGSGSSLSGTTFLTFAGGNVNAGASCTFDVTVQVPGGAADGSYNNVTSSLTATIGGNMAALDPATDQLVVDSSRLELTKEFIDDPVGPGDSVTLRFNLTNLDTSQAASNIAFTDDLDAALTGLAATGLPASVCGGGTLSGTDTVTLSGASLAAGASCQFDVTLSVPPGASAGSVVTNTTSGVTGTIGGGAVTGTPASDDLFIDAVVFTKAFSGPTTASGTSVLSFTIQNRSAVTPISDLAFSDDLSSVVTGLTASSLPGNPCGAGSSLTGSSFLTLTGGNLPAGGSCTFDINLSVPVSATAGSFTNTTSPLTQLGLTLAQPASATLTIEPPPAFAKSFAPTSVGLGLPSRLSFTIDNSASALAANSLAFTDNLPAGLVIAAPANSSNSCGGTLTATAGSGSLSLSGGSVAAGSNCLIQVDVIGTAAGAMLNTSGTLSSSSGLSGTASATLTVNPQPGFTKSFAPNPVTVGQVSTLIFTIDNTGSSSAASSLNFTDNLPNGLRVATPANATTTCTGGTLTAVSATDLISYSGGSVAAGTACTLSVDVINNSSGSYVNTTGNLTSSLGSSGTATDILAVDPTLTVTATGSGSGSVSGTGINCTVTAGVASGDCSESPSGSTLFNLTATPAAGLEVKAWSGCDSISGTAGEQCSLTLIGDQTVTIEFSASDNDGVSAQTEDQVPNPNGGNGDGNGDGTADSEQREVTSLLSSVGSHWVTIANETGGFQQANVQSLPVPGDVPADLQFPAGVLSFEITGMPVGGTVEMSVYVPSNLGATSYYKRNSSGEWINVTKQVTTVGDKVRITFDLTDGDEFDGDGIANGTIQDPGAPAARAGSATPIPTLNQWGLLGLTLLFGLLLMSQRYRQYR
ncbi:MAG: IPTL-CTERM sorting domain-containing protein [Chromatiales bacterium]|nr:IPTL-CTERM sorting domain-containing protein [Chromatiales bacterium]